MTKSITAASCVKTRPSVIVTSDNFLVFTKPGDFGNPKARSIAASHAAKFGPGNSYKLREVWPDKPDRGVLRWRLGESSHRLVRAKTRSRQKAPRQQEHHEAVWHINEDIPQSVQARVSLQQFFEANPSTFYYPALIMLNAGSSSTAAFFQTINLDEVYHAVMGMLLSWLVSQYPTQYPASAALFHQTEAISIIRQRLSQGLHDEVTYLSILCAMQTSALLGDMQALLAHERGLEDLDYAMNTPLSDYCRTIRPRHKALVREALGCTRVRNEHHLKQSKTRRRSNSSSSDDAEDLILSLPKGFRDMMDEHQLFEKDIIKHWTKYFAQVGRVRSHDASTLPDLNHGVPIYALIGEIRRILETLDDGPSHLKRFVYLADYLYLSSKYYRRIMQSSPEFQDYRREATEFIDQYEPRNLHDRNILLHSSLLVIHSWKIDTLLEPEGLLLVASLKWRFPEVQDWSVLRALMEDDYFHLGQVMEEWGHSWAQSDPDYLP